MTSPIRVAARPSQNLAKFKPYSVVQSDCHTIEWFTDLAVAIKFLDSMYIGLLGQAVQFGNVGIRRFVASAFALFRVTLFQRRAAQLLDDGLQCMFSAQRDHELILLEAPASVQTVPVPKAVQWEEVALQRLERFSGLGGGSAVP